MKNRIQYQLFLVAILAILTTSSALNDQKDASKVPANRYQDCKTP